MVSDLMQILNELMVGCDQVSDDRAVGAVRLLKSSRLPPALCLAGIAIIFHGTQVEVLGLPETGLVLRREALGVDGGRHEGGSPLSRNLKWLVNHFY
jgi:hypothetical protein